MNSGCDCDYVVRGFTLIVTAKQIRIHREWIILTDGDGESSAEIELAALMKGVVLRLRKIVDR